MDLRDARRRQTLRELDRLDADVGRWVTHRKDSDVGTDGYKGRYETQLGAISDQVLAAASRIRALVTHDAVQTRTTGEVYRDFNLHDQRLIWVRYAWSYFSDKLDQRDNQELRAVLEAADEVSWACYSIFFRSAGMSVPAAPIPYIEYDYVPSALRTSQGHVLSRKPEGPLKDYFEALPVPLLRLPPGVATAPWSLALICHEVGHLLQGHVEPELGFFATFASLVSGKVEAAGGAEAEQRLWSAWSQEIFADMCMAVTAGPWAVWALAPWALTAAQAMDVPQDKYPPPAVRLRLLDHMSRAAGHPPADEIFTRLGIQGGGSALAEAVAQLAAEQLKINGKTRSLGEFLGSSPATMGPLGRVRQWSEQLLGKGTLLPETDKTSARDAVVAAARAHFVALQTDADLEALESAAQELMRASHDPGVRAGTESLAPAKSLSDALFAMSDEAILAVA